LMIPLPFPWPWYASHSTVLVPSREGFLWYHPKQACVV
jgi:hypothetical protein